VSFPFDVSLCQIHIQLLQTLGCKPTWSQNLSHHFIAELSSTAALYDVTAIKLRASASDPNVLVLKFLVSRTCPSYILTTFIPNSVITVLGIFTLTHFRFENFNMQMSVTVSNLIVISTLFSNIVSNIPHFPVPKTVEVFFFYCIMRLCFVYFIHSILRNNDKGFDFSKISKMIYSEDVKFQDSTLKIVKPRPVKVHDNFSFKKATLMLGYLIDFIALLYFIISVQVDKDAKYFSYES